MTLFVAVVLVLRFFENLFIDILSVSSRNVTSDKSSQVNFIKSFTDCFKANSCIIIWCGKFYRNILTQKLQSYLLSKHLQNVEPFMFLQQLELNTNVVLESTDS